MKVSSPCFVGSFVFAFRKTRRCGYFFGFKRFSKNRQKVHEMAHLEATVASALKNWYINFFLGGLQVPGNANWCQNSEIFREIGVFRFQAFPGPPKGPRKNKKIKDIFLLVFWCPGGWHKSLLGPPGPHGSFLAAPSFNEKAAISSPWPPMGPHGAPWPPQGPTKKVGGFFGGCLGP